MPKELNENAKKWVAALRSGEYTQAKRQLRTETGMCCLGVACDLYSKETGEQWDGHKFLGEDDTLPLQVKEWVGLTGPEGVFLGDSNMPTALSTKNDIGATFAEIADIIESQPEGLFV